MNQRMTKRLRKTLLKNTPKVLILLQSHYGNQTKKVETPQAVWRQFKKIYKMGKVPANMIMKLEKEKV